MTMFTFLIIVYTLIGNLQWSAGNQEIAIGLEILPESLSSTGHNILHRRVEDQLNLTCRVISSKHLDNHHDLPQHKLSWHLPHLIQQNSQNRVVDVESYNSRQLIVEHLREGDAGDYSCHARLLDQPHILLFNQSVRVLVKNKKPLCADTMFACTSRCIMPRFVCDGKVDCKDGADEDVQRCGINPCLGKQWCPDEGRCISMSWCCDPNVDANCTAKVKPNCCLHTNKHFLNGGGYPDGTDKRYPDLTDQQRFNDMGFLQTTIYTVIGCAMAFMFIVTILVIAICRVHMKRSLLSRCPNARVNRGPGANARARNAAQQVPLYDLDVFLNRSTFPPESSPHSGLLVTYNINNGIQFVGRPVDPPPYCEVVASPPREGPPPPYASRENLDYEPLLATENFAGNTLRITVVNTVPRSESRGGEGGLRRVAAITPARQSLHSPAEDSPAGDPQSESQSISGDSQLVPANAQALLAETGVIVASPQSTVANTQSVVANPQSVVGNPQSVVANPQSVVANPQSIVANPQSVAANPQSIVADEQASRQKRQVVSDEDIQCDKTPSPDSCRTALLTKPGSVEVEGAATASLAEGHIDT